MKITLIDLMIVVSVIGILAAIAAPNFLKFQCKLRWEASKYPPDEAEKKCTEDMGSKPEEEYAAVELPAEMGPKWVIICFDPAGLSHRYEAKDVVFWEHEVIIEETSGRTVITNLKCVAEEIRSGATPGAPPTDHR